MRTVVVLAAAVLLTMAQPAYAQDVSVADNAEMSAMFEADQAARKGDNIDWQTVMREDVARLKRTRELLDADALNTADDYYNAAFIFQHGDEAEDYLLSHVLAVRSLALGKEEAEWIAAASLDRYLQSIARGQIFGTQRSMSVTKPANQGRYDRDFLTDKLRVESGVEPLSEQQAKLAEMEENRPAEWKLP
ncbi:hypothetical protein [Qipengyuania atrilutea]|uniref:Uncharacterized protein n=1 Tax=Qipengyuania atrilutea TaxID=2744473 RepID=A0A850H317_9SPHN|nr:hypothetical protein [Actirhodobacter atriluteus]NVD44298.1 hypothetical protein [Actirhodobacter atriluteus]